MTMRITHVVIVFLSLSLAACTTYFEDAYAANKRGNYIEAVRLYRLAAAQGDAGAQNNLGAMYDRGRGVAQDYKEAVRLYRLAAAQGYDFAQNNLGTMYQNGLGVAQDYKEAVRLYRLAAAQGYDLAQINLGKMYQNGDGVDKNYVMAYLYYDLAYQNGVAGSANEIAALNIRENLSLDMSKTDIELAQQQSKAILMAQSQRKLSAAQAAARESCNTASFFKALGAMASSDSRYLGSAIAQGAGAGANARSQC